MNCAVCSHSQEMHRGACGDKECSCLCFLEASVLSEPFDPVIDIWQEKVMMAVLDLIIEEREGTVHIKTKKDGIECKVKIAFVPEVPGMTLVSYMKVGKV